MKARTLKQYMVDNTKFQTLGDRKRIMLPNKMINSNYTTSMEFDQTSSRKEITNINIPGKLEGFSSLPQTGAVKVKDVVDSNRRRETEQKQLATLYTMDDSDR